MLDSIILHTRTYRTTQDRDTGLTTVICNYCEASYIAGTDPNIHLIGCPEYQAKRPKRIIKAITRIIHFTMYAEVDEKGGLIIP